MHKKTKRILAVVFALALCLSLQVTAFAEGSGDVASAVQSTWTAASGQIKTVTNNVIFPALDMILAIFFFVKLGAAYFDYRQGNRFDCAACDPLRLSGLYPDRSHLHLDHHRSVRQKDGPLSHIRGPPTREE